MADSKENYYWDLGSENLINRDTCAEQGYTQFPLNSTENPNSNLLEKYLFCLEMPGDAKNYICSEQISWSFTYTHFLLRINNLAI